MIFKDTKVGSKVYLRSDSEHYSKDYEPANPANVIGEVVGIELCFRLPVEVKWSNGWTNSYTFKDLNLHKPKRDVWFPKALEMHYAKKSSKAISKELGVPARTIRHNIQKHLEKFPPLQGKPSGAMTTEALQESISELRKHIPANQSLQILHMDAELERQLLSHPKLHKGIEDLRAIGHTGYVAGGIPALKHINIEEILNEAVPVSKKKPTIFVIPDTQCKQGVDLGYMHWIGYYISLKKPDIIVHLGDHYDMAALSSYDKGKLSAEGKRVKEDMDAGDEGIRILESYIRKVPNYNPRRVVTLGNHEDRIDRFVQENPAFEGYIGTDKLAFADFGWEVYPFLTPVNICGINFVHYIQNPMNGKPMGGSALSRLKNIGTSYVMGHVQTYDFCQRPLQLTGQMQLGLIVGACYEHDEGYKGVQGNHHFRGCVMLYDCADGYAMHKPIQLSYLKEVYERGTK